MEGTRFMGGFAVQDNAIEHVKSKLDEIQRMFYSELQIFLAEFEVNTDAWINDEGNKEFAHILRDQVPDRETVSDSFHFSFKLYKLQPLEGFEPDENEVANQILYEVGLDCKQMSNRLLKRKHPMSGKTLFEQLNVLIKKLDILSFGNSRILKVLNEFLVLQKSIPLEKIEKEHPTFGQVITFLSLCSDSSKLEQIIDGHFSVCKLIEGMQRSTLVSNSIGTTSIFSTSTQAAAVNNHTVISSSFF